MKFKSGVYVRGFCPEMVLGLLVLDGVYRDAGCDMIVTSGADGEHSSKSLHYSGRAADLRISNVPENKRETILLAAKANLPHDFDIVLEPDHFHLEYDPRGRLR